MTWHCRKCGTSHQDPPLCFAAEAPWRALVPESEFSRRVELTEDQCVVDGGTFFARGHIELPIHGQADPLSFSVWSSLSEESFRDMSERWYAPERAGDLPYFGWLCSPVPVYPDTLHLKLSVQARAPGIVPLFTIEPSSHPLSLDQQHGISVMRWHDMAHSLLHGG